MKLLTGPGGSGKTARVLREFRDALRSGLGGSRLLVPTTTLSEHLQNLLARDGAAFRSREVETLARFAAEIIPGLKVVQPEHFSLMVENSVIELNRAEFEKVRDLAGFHARLEKTISDLDGAGCTPERLRRVNRDWAPFRDAVAAVWEDVQKQMRRRGVATRGEQLRAIATNLPTATLPARLWIDGFAQFSGPEMDLICALGARIPLTVTLPDEGVPAHLKPALLARGFVEEALAGGRSPETILIMPETAEREADEIARRIVEQSRKGTPFREMGVILRQPAKYAPLLRAAFERFGTPAHFYVHESLQTHAVGRLLAGIVDALLGGWEHERVLGLLRLFPLTGASNALDIFEIKLRKALPGQGLAPLADLGAKSPGLQRLFRKLGELETWLSAKYTPAEWADQFHALPALFWPGQMKDRPSRDLLAEYRAQAAGLQEFQKAIQSAAEWWARDAKPVRLEEFWRVAKSIIRLTKVSAPQGARNAVHVINAYEARQWDLSTVFVCGLVEKEFPAQNGRDPFFSDAALTDLARQGVHTRTAKDKEEEEFGLFDAVEVCARDLLVLSYPRTDARGQKTLPSIFLKGRIPETVSVSARPALPPPIAQWRRTVSVSSPDLLEILPAQHKTLSVSALETLLQCPFQFFAKCTLHVSEMPKRPEDRLDFLLQGNIVHDVLSAWASSRGDIDAIFAESFRRICEEKRILDGFRKSRLRRALSQAAERFARDKQYPAPMRAGTEIQFEFPLSPELHLKGRLDRVDELDDQKAVIIDYKFSRAEATKKKVEDESRLQGPLYALAVERHRGLKVLAMAYASLKDNTVTYSGWGEIPGAGLRLAPMTADWIPNALARVDAAVAKLRSGVIQPRPLQKDPCRYCTYRDACQIGEAAVLTADVV